jgi:hypothetical protein
MGKIDTSWTRDWLSKERCLPDELKADMQRDPTIPRLFRNIKQLRAYLVERKAGAGTLVDVPRIWRSYSRWISRNPWGLYHEDEHRGRSGR